MLAAVIGSFSPEAGASQDFLTSGLGLNAQYRAPPTAMIPITIPNSANIDRAFQSMP
jgi:hypothetical protein